MSSRTKRIDRKLCILMLKRMTLNKTEFISANKSSKSSQNNNKRQRFRPEY